MAAPIENAEDLIKCKFLLKKKNRQCRLRALQGQHYCGEHLLVSSENGEAHNRIPCPLDPAHTCFAHLVQQHVKKCNARSKPQEIHYVKDVNVGLALDDGIDHEKVMLGELSDDQLMQFINRIKQLHNEHCRFRVYEGPLHAAFADTLDNFKECNMAQKHLVQQAALLAIAQQKSLLEDDTCFVEFGAGRGRLCAWIMESVPDARKCSYLLVDKGTPRHKADNRRKDDLGDLTTRMRIGIEDLALGRVECVRRHGGRVVGTCKHLCGVATDYALRCCTDTLRPTSPEVDQEPELAKAQLPLGLVMATCCHHRCLWRPFCGREFFQQIGLNRRDFGIMCAIAGWATCNSSDIIKPPRANQIDQKADADSSNLADAEPKQNRYQKLGLKADDRKEIGFMCKMLMDTGRCKYLRQRSMEAELVKFVEDGVTLENMAIVATSNNKA